MQALAGSNPDEDVAVDSKTAQGLNLPEIHLEAMDSQDIPFRKGEPTEHIKRVILYHHSCNDEAAGTSILYLALQMSYRGTEEDAIFIVGIFNGYADKERTSLMLTDLDKDGVPEVALHYQAGADADIMRIFQFAKRNNIADDTSNIPISAVLRQIGYYGSGLGHVALGADGTVTVIDYVDESRKKAKPVKKYRLVDGVMKEIEK